MKQIAENISVVLKSRRGGQTVKERENFGERERTDLYVDHGGGYTIVWHQSY